MTQPVTPSLVPSSVRPVTWPMVALALVRELPYTASVLGGVVVSIALISHGDGSTFEKLGAVIIPAIVSALAKGQPPNASLATSGGVLGLLLAVARHHR